MSAAHTYRLYVDGASADAWPSFSYPDEQYVRAVDLTGALTGGRSSAIGVLHRWYGPGQGRPASSPGLLLQLSVRYTDGRHAVFGSDATWRERAAEWLPSPQRNADVGDFVEWVDGRLHPQGWSSPGFDDSTWSPVTVIGPAGTAPFTATYAQRTTIRETPVHPVRLHTLASGAVVADFGAVYAARPRVAFARGEPGRTVTLRAGYLLDPDGQVSTLHGTQETNLTSSYIMTEGGQAFEAFTYFGFRYLQIANAGQPLHADDIVALTRHAAMPDVPTATFSTDDRMLNAVWRLTTRSCLYCSNEQFVDTPTREKGPFLWDGANESEAVMPRLRRPEPDLAGLAGRGPRPSAVLAGRAGQRRLSKRGRSTDVRHQHGALSRVGVALLHLDGRQRDGRGPVPIGGPGRRVVVEHPPGRNRAPLRAGGSR